MQRGPNRANIVDGNIVLVSKRDYQDAKCDILLRYTDEQVRELARRGEIPEKYNFAVKEAEDTKEDDMPFDFATI
ncbi:unnamed protein product [Sphagnum balticum]